LFYLQKLCLEICCAEGKCSGCHISLSLQNTPQSNETTVCGKGLFEFAIFACKGTLFMHYKKPATVLVRTDSSLDLLNSPGNFSCFPFGFKKKLGFFVMWVSYLQGPACSYAIDYTRRVGFFMWLSHSQSCACSYAMDYTKRVGYFLLGYLTHRFVHAIMQQIISKGLDFSCLRILLMGLCMQLCNGLYQKEVCCSDHLAVQNQV
jgi:hypothetical protein